MTYDGQLEAYLGMARNAASLGAAVLRQAWQGSSELDIQTKGSSIDLVTQFDRASESEIVKYLQEVSDIAIMAEESASETPEGLKWVIDPLDGTTNFSHGLPFFCVSVALVDGHESLVGVVNAPALGMEFYAVQGRGAWVSGTALVLGDTKTMDSALVAFGCGDDRHERRDRYVPPFEAFMTRTQGMRRLGSAALDCCMLSKGWVDAYFEVNLKPWDLAAGALIASQAGAVVTDVSGAPFDAFTGRILAARPQVHAAMLEVIRQEGLFAGETDR